MSDDDRNNSTFVKAYVEPSSHLAIVHNLTKVSARLRGEEDGFAIHREAATSLVDCADGVVWCGDCFPDREPQY